MDINDKINLQLKDEFFEEEIRCDFKVTKKTKKIWAIELDLLNELLRVCKKYDIKVFVFGGTLLGAVRHNGFIPWDDDIDVCMIRPEYERFLKVAASEFKHPYFLQTALSDRGYFFAYARLRNSLTTGYITEYSAEDYNQGIYMDIFVLDGYIENERLFKKQIKYRNRLLKLARYYRGSYVKNNPLKKIVSIIIKKVLPYEKFVTIYNNNLSKYNSCTERLSLVTHTVNFTRKYHCLKSDLSEQLYLDFENLKVPAPKEYKTMLANMYGNYMEYPPLDKRGMWHSGQLVFEPDIPYLDFIKQTKLLIK